MPTKKPKTTQIKDADNSIIEPNTLLEIEKGHKDWYDVNQMGRQGGKPVNVPREMKKPKGAFKHSARKGK